MLVGYGLRGGGAGRVFRAIGATILSVPSSAFLTLTGVILHVVVMLACGVLYVSLVTNGDEHRFAWAIAIGAAIAAIALILVRALGGSIALMMTPGSFVALGVVTAVTLPIGMRFAPSRV
jgi:hypothetical protein